MKGTSEDGGAFDVEAFLLYTKLSYENCEKIDKCRNINDERKQNVRYEEARQM